MCIGRFDSCFCEMSVQGVCPISSWARLRVVQDLFSFLIYMQEFLTSTGSFLDFLRYNVIFSVHIYARNFFLCFQVFCLL